MHTEQMLGSTFAFPAALTWVTDSTKGATKLASRSICLRHVKLTMLRNSTKSQTTSVQLNKKNHLFLGNAENLIISLLLGFLFHMSDGRQTGF